MTDLLSIATFATDQLLHSGGFAGFTITFVITSDGPIVEISDLSRWTYMEVANMSTSRTAAILAEMKRDNHEAVMTFCDEVDERVEVKGRRMRREGVIRTGEGRYSLSTGSGRSEATAIAQTLLVGAQDVVGFSNNLRREFSLPKRALSMASSKGRCTPDMLASLMSFFSNPGDMAHTLLASFLPTKVSTADASTLLSDPFVVDVIEGLGFTLPTPAQAVKMVKNPCTSRSGGARRVSIYSPGVEPTVDAKRRGRPSGPKYVAFLPFGAPAPLQGCEDIKGLCGGNDVAQGQGRDAGVGWDGAWSKGHALSPAQVQRRDAALDAFHLAASKQVEAE